MYIHLCKGLTRCINALKYNEIMRSYAGITRIRFMGMISATVSRAPLHCKFINYFNITDEMFRISSRRRNRPSLNLRSSLIFLRFFGARKLQVPRNFINSLI